MAIRQQKTSPKAGVQPVIPLRVTRPAAEQKKMNGAEIKRRQVRDELWPNAEMVTWYRKREKGFATIPRTLSLMMTLIKHLAKKGDPSRAYLDLWARVSDDGLVVVGDEAEFAISSGYIEGTRHVRTWNEHMNTLEELGFIVSRPKSGRKHGYILLLHPHRVIARIQNRQPDLIPPWWLQSYRERVREIGSKERGYKTLGAFVDPPPVQG